MVAQLDTGTEEQHEGQRVVCYAENLGCPDMSPQEIIEEAQKLSLAEQEAIANQLTYNVLGEMQNLGFKEA
jgi:hypothetical protein